MTGGAAAVALPIGRILRIAANDDLALRAKGYGARRTIGQGFNGAIHTCVGNTKQGEFIAGNLAIVAGKENALPIRRPADHTALAVQIGQPARTAAVRLHDIDLGIALFAADKGQPGAIRREHGMSDFADITRQPARRPPRPGHLP